jgi:photosystem II stability/assembly factor-like uncharacterized protein
MRPRTRGALAATLALLIAACRGEGPPDDLAIRPPEAARRPGGIPGAYQALIWWAGQRAYPNAEIAGEGYALALEQRQEMEAAVAGLDQGTPWEPIGPHNIAGRMLAVVLNPVNPRTVWAGSASGGLWRSTTEGRGTDAWDRVPTGHGVLGVSAIAIHPADTLTIYIGTGEVYRYQDALGGAVYRPSRGSYGVGILKSVDGGATWTKVLDWSRSQERGVQMIRLDPADPNTVWAATTEGIWVSRDGGSIWTISLSTVMATDLTINPSNPLEIVAACGNQNSPGRGIYRSIDGGTTWTRITAGLPGSWIGKVLLDRHPTQPSTVYASIGNGIDGSTSTWLVRSTDGGATWSTVTTTNYGSYQGWFSHYVGVNPIDPDTVLLGGVELWRSLTGGASPERRTNYSGLPSYPPIGGPDSPNPEYMHPDHHAMVWHPTDPMVAYFANDGGIYRTDDAGASFESVNGGLQTAQFYNGASVAFEDSTRMMGGLQDNGTVMFLGDARWRRPLSGDGAWTATDPRTRDRIYMSYQYLNVFRSEDGGGSLIDIRPPSGQWAFIAPYALAPSNPDRLYAAGNFVYRSLNRGDTWTILNGGNELDPAGNLALGLSVAPSDPQVVYVTTAPNLTASGNNPGPPNLFVTTDGGVTWTQRTAGLPNRFFPDVAVHPAQPLTAYVTVSGFGTGHVFKTIDGGATWLDVTNGLPDIPTSAIVVDPLAPSHVYVGTDVGVFVSRDAGASWNAFTEGLPDALMIMDLVISPSDRTLRAATHGNGMYSRRLERNPVAGEPGPAASGPAIRVVGPNPFVASSTVEVVLPEASVVRVDLFDAAGRRVATLADGRRGAGRHRIAVDGRGLSAGAYVVRLEADGRRFAARLTRRR